MKGGDEAVEFGQVGARKFRLKSSPDTRQAVGQVFELFQGHCFRQRALKIHLKRVMQQVACNRNLTSQNAVAASYVILGCRRKEIKLSLLAAHDSNSLGPNLCRALVSTR